jgi:hypothetical protein
VSNEIRAKPEVDVLKQSVGDAGAKARFGEITLAIVDAETARLQKPRHGNELGVEQEIMHRAARTPIVGNVGDSVTYSELVPIRRTVAKRVARAQRSIDPIHRAVDSLRRADRVGEHALHGVVVTERAIQIIA